MCEYVCGGNVLGYSRMVSSDFKLQRCERVIRVGLFLVCARIRDVRARVCV